MTDWDVKRLLILLAACGTSHDAPPPTPVPAPKPPVDAAPDAIVIDAVVATPFTLERARAMLGTKQTIASLEATVSDYAFHDRYGNIIGHRDDNPAPDFVDIDFVLSSGEVVRIDIGTPTLPDERGIHVGQTYRDLRGIPGLKCEGWLEADISQTDCTDTAERVTYTLDKYYDRKKIPATARIRAYSIGTRGR